MFVRRALGILAIALVVYAFWPSEWTPWGRNSNLPQTNRTPTTVLAAPNREPTTTIRGCSPGDGTTPTGVEDIPEGPAAFGYWSVKTSATSWGVIDIPVGSDTLFCIDRKKAVRFKYLYLDGTTKVIEDTKQCAKDNSCKHDHHTGVDEIHFQATDPEEEDYLVVRIYPRS